MTNEETRERLNEQYSQILSLRSKAYDLIPAVVEYVAGLSGFKKAYPELAAEYAEEKAEMEAAEEGMAEIKSNWVARALENDWAAVGEELSYNDAVYEVIQGHRAQFGWEPDITPALFKRKADPGEEWPEFVHPTGAHDCYHKGDKITFEGEHYVSLIDNNSWSPTEYPAGWEKQA